MGIITLVKANIRKKRNTFISIAILTVIIVTSMTVVSSVWDNHSRALDKAFKDSDYGDILAFIEKKNLTDDLRKKVESHSLVERVKYFDSIQTKSVSFGDNTSNNRQFLMEMRDGILLYNKSLDAFEDEIPELKSGEIYIPLGLKEIIDCEAGDVLKYNIADGFYEFKVRGFVQEAYMGAANIGWKQSFISSEDFNKIRESDSVNETTVMMVYKTEGCKLSDAKFQRQINLDTKLIANSLSSLTASQAYKFTGIMFETLLYCLLVFTGILFVIVLIVISNSITAEIEMDYADIGILKSLGFTKGKISLIIILQYIFAEIVGIIIGNLVAMPLEPVLGNILMHNTAILPNKGICVAKSLLFILIILFVSVVIILIKTIKIGRISPVKVINGTREDIYFDSRFNMPISKNALSVTLGCRQFTSGKRRYAGTIMIVAILTFFMMTANLISGLLTSRTALEAMGTDITDIDVVFKDSPTEEYISEIEAVVEAHSDIKKKYYSTSGYMSLNGENMRYDCCKYPENINAILKGRRPKYENEIIITEIVADTLDINMGDEVALSYQDKEGRFIITGIYQSSQDAGVNFALTLDGGKKLGIENISYMGFSIKDVSKNKEISEVLAEEFGDIVTVKYNTVEDDGMGGSINMAVDAIKAIIYVFSVFFIFVVVVMVCQRTFAQERVDIGIYKAMGFTSKNLRFQFAFRFLTVSLLGATFGIVLSVLFSAKLLGSILKAIGISKVVMDFTFLTVFIPMVVMGICFFAFSYFASRKVKKIAVRELVVE